MNDNNLPHGEQDAGAPSGAIITLDPGIETQPFDYLRLDIRPDRQTGGQTVTHSIRAHGPVQPRYLLFTHFRPRGGVRGDVARYDRFCDSTPDTRSWAAGEIITIEQAFRVPPGHYDVLVGFAVPGRGERMPLPGHARDVLTVGQVTIEAAPLALLQRSADLLPAPFPDQDDLLRAVLALPGMDCDQRDHLALCFGQAPQFGHVLEFGVAAGKSINHLAELAPGRTIWGFDTFEGLPEDWVRSDVRTREKGTFSQGGHQPPVLENVSLVQGLIQDTLPGWLAQHPGNAAFVHVDVDIYSAAKFVLTALNDRIIPATVIVFDDLGVWDALASGHAGGYDNWRDGEWKALVEWLAECGRSIAVTSRMLRSTLGTRVLG